MKKSALLFALFALCFSLFGTAGEPLELRDVLMGKFRAEGMAPITPIPGDPDHYTQSDRSRSRVIRYAFKTGQPVDTLFDASVARQCPFARFDSYSFSPDGSTLLFATETHSIYRHSYTAVHYLYSLKRNIEGKINNIVEALSDGGPQQVPVFSPDASMVAFVRDNNIFLVKRNYGNSESQVTLDGKRNCIINGAPDWVYEEEFSFNCAMEFSADSKMLAYVRFDESQVPEYSFPLFAGQAPRIDSLSKYPGAYTYKYPKTGEVNSTVSVHTFDIRSRVTRTMQLPLDRDGYIPRIRFTRDPDKLAILTLNRHQDRLDIYFADPRSTLCTLVVRDEVDKYVKEDVFDSVIFYDDNFSMLSERDGYNHLYWYNMNGTLQRQVTQGEYEVKQFLGYAEDEQAFYYLSNVDSPMQTALFRTDRKGKTTRLSTQVGVNAAQFGDGMKYYVNRYTNLNTPAVVTINDRTGRELVTMVDNARLRSQLAESNLPTKEFFSFTTSQGTRLNGWIMRAADFDETQQHPALLYQYSGPGSQTVMDNFSISWETYMASRGYVVICVDGRGTGGRGAAFEKCTYMQLGVKEAEDQVETALYAASLPYVDAARIGIWGWSFGGYMTLMSMSEGRPVFRAGVAVAPVTDWNYYDTIYGERFMRTPQENPDGYTAGSAISRADKLSGDLLLVHGMADDNVHFQNSAEYAEQLVQLGKQFDMQIYTNRNHSIFGGNTRLHLYTRLTNFFDERLLQ